MSRTKATIIAVIAALVLDGVCILCFMGFGPDGPASPLVYVAFALLPAVKLGEFVGTFIGMTSILVPVLGFLEFFIPFWLLLRLIYGRRPA